MIQIFLLIVALLNFVSPIYACQGKSNQITIMLSVNENYTPLGPQWCCSQEYINLLDHYGVECTMQEAFKPVRFCPLGNKIEMSNYVEPLKELARITHIPDKMIFNGKKLKKNDEKLFEFSREIQGQKYSFVVEFFSPDQIPIGSFHVKKLFLYFVGLTVFFVLCKKLYK